MFVLLLLYVFAIPVYRHQDYLPTRFIQNGAICAPTTNSHQIKISASQSAIAPVWVLIKIQNILAPVRAPKHYSLSIFAPFILRQSNIRNIRITWRKNWYLSIMILIICYRNTHAILNKYCLLFIELISAIIQMLLGLLIAWKNDKNV